MTHSSALSGKVLVDELERLAHLLLGEHKLGASALFELDTVDQVGLASGLSQRELFLSKFFVGELEQALLVVALSSGGLSLVLLLLHDSKELLFNNLSLGLLVFNGLVALSDLAL